MRSRIQSSGPPSKHCRTVTARPGRALFELDAELYDDGSPGSLKEFTRGALGHERFTSIDRVENDGLDLTGAFHSDRWGDFQTYFRLQLSPAGKINRLDIGQAT